MPTFEYLFLQSFFKNIALLLDSQLHKFRSIKKLTTYLYITVLFVVAVNLFYGELFELWQTQLPGIGADGAKNYYTLAYHIIHDSSFWWFDGMNYPHGEHLMFTDNQPLIANFLKLLDQAIPVSDNLHWLLPFLTFFSSWIAALLIGSFIRKTQIHDAFTAIISVGIILLSPQLIRLSGHYSLSHAFVLPLVFWLCFKLYQTWKLKTALSLGITLILIGFIHPYLLAMSSLFVLLFFLVQLLTDKQATRLHSWLKAAAVSLLPLIIFQLILKLSDPISDRPEAPYGYLIYRATLSSIFMPTELWYMNPIKEALPFLYKRAAEGGFYVGVFAISVTLWAFSKLAINRFRSFRNLSFVRKFALICLIASVPVALLSLGLPFVIGPFESLLEHTGPLKQFRGIGRFSFVFYYAVNLYAGVELAHYFKQDSTKRNMSIVTLCAGILWYEAYSFKTHIIDYTSHGTSWLNGQQWEEASIASDEFQAIIPVPYFHTGSENFRTDDKQANLAPSFGLSQETGLPLMSVQMSRTSLSQTLASLQLQSKLLSKPGLTNELDQKKPFLLLVDQTHTMSDYELQLVYHSKPFYKKEHLELRRLPSNEFDQILKENIKKAESQLKEAVVIDKLETNNEHLYYQSFDEIKSTNTFKGQGAKTVERNDWSELIPSDFILEDSSDYELSFWFYAADQNAVNTQVWYWSYLDGNEVEFQLSEVGDHRFAVENNWILVSLPIEWIGPNQTMRVSLHRDGKKMPITFDEVLLKPTHLHTTKKGSLNVNNRYFESVSSAIESK